MGSIPDRKYYDPEGMKPHEMAAFETWYRQQTGIFDLQKELVAYCKSDVELLKKGCEAFVKQFKKEADFNPFERYTTIASACIRYWRQHHLPDQKITVEPPARLERCERPNVADGSRRIKEKVTLCTPKKVIIGIY